MLLENQTKLLTMLFENQTNNNAIRKPNQTNNNVFRKPNQTINNAHQIYGNFVLDCVIEELYKKKNVLNVTK